MCVLQLTSCLKINRSSKSILFHLLDCSFTELTYASTVFLTLTIVYGWKCDYLPSLPVFSTTPLHTPGLRRHPPRPPCRRCCLACTPPVRHHSRCPIIP